MIKQNSQYKFYKACSKATSHWSSFAATRLLLAMVALMFAAPLQLLPNGKNQEPMRVR